ncbi:MAG: glycosyltransferase family 39 protein [Terriglobales bacterium]
MENSYATWVALALVIAGGTLPRLNHIGKSIWSAEAWVANSVLADSLGQMFHYDAWLQTTPPLFLLLVRGTVHLAGVSVASFRAVPFGLSVLSLVLIARLSRLTLRAPFAVLCTTLLALSPPAVVFSKEVKQYSGDVAASCLLLLVLWRYLEQPDRKRYVYLTVAVAVALLLSYPAVTFVPGAIAIVAAVEPLDGDHANAWKNRIPRVSILGTLAALLCIVNYWFFVKPNTSALLTDYWSDGYPRFGHLKDIARFYAEYFLGMGVYFYLPIATKNLFRSMLSSAGHLPLLLIAIATMVGAALAPAALRRNRRHLQALALCFMPLITLAVLNLLHLYPVNSRRLTLFMLPCMALAAAIVLQSMWDTLSKRMGEKTISLFSALITLSCIGIVFVAGIHSDQWSNYWFEDEDTAGAFRYLRSHAAPDDTIYIHASIAEPAKLYFRILRWNPPDVRYGNTGWGCCPRNPEPRPDAASSKRDYVVQDFERVMEGKRAERLWLVFTARNGHWGEVGRDEPQIIASYLYGIGCRKEQEARFANEALDEFGCGQRNSR